MCLSLDCHFHCHFNRPIRNYYLCFVCFIHSISHILHAAQVCFQRCFVSYTSFCLYITMTCAYKTQYDTEIVWLIFLFVTNIDISNRKFCVFLYFISLCYIIKMPEFLEMNVVRLLKLMQPLPEGRSPD